MPVFRPASGHPKLPPRMKRDPGRGRSWNTLTPAASAAARWAHRRQHQRWRAQPLQPTARAATQPGPSPASAIASPPRFLTRRRLPGPGQWPELVRPLVRVRQEGPHASLHWQLALEVELGKSRPPYVRANASAFSGACRLGAAKGLALAAHAASSRKRTARANFNHAAPLSRIVE